MHDFLLKTAWLDEGAQIATMVSSLALIFIFFEYIANKNVRNIQLMQRCIDNFRDWFADSNKKVDFYYLELLNEELFYFQKKLIAKGVALEWIEGILDYITVFANDKTPLNKYSRQVNVEDLDQWDNNQYFFYRIYYFINTKLNADYALPDCNEKDHHFKKRQLAEQLYKHIKNYKY